MTSQSPYPLQISSNRRHLINSEGRPFLIHGDTAWSIITALTQAEADHYLQDRAAKGFNAIIVNLIEHKFNGPFNRAGEHPFHNPQDLSTPNENYFAHADWVLERAAHYGILVLLAPMYLGYKMPANDEGWVHEAHLSGPHKCYQYGRFLGQRYSGYQNILWMAGGDRNPDGVVDEIYSMIMGIKDFDDHALFTAHAHPDEPTAERYGWGGWLDLNATYTYQIVHRKLLMDYNRKPTLPFVLMESTYEGEHNASELQIRRQAYWALLCGSCGQFLGNRPMWLFNPGWQEALDSRGSNDMVHLKHLFLTRPWHTLIPDQAHQIVTAGWGEELGLDTLTAALSADRGTLIAYLPEARPIIVDLEKLSGQDVNAWWYNPRTGEAEGAGSFAPRGEQIFTPPAAGDWVLVIDDAALGLGAPGTNDTEA